MRLRTRIVTAWIVASSLLLGFWDRGLADGGFDPAGEIVGYRSVAADGVTIAVGLPRVLFTLNWFAGKYKVVPVTIENKSAADLQLSRSEDWLEFEFKDRKLRGVIDLATVDAEAWQQIGDDAMKKLAGYGGTVGRGATRRVIVFVPKWPAGEFPVSITLSIT